MRVAVVQSGGCGPSVPENREALADLVRQASASRPDLVLLPELSTTPYFASGPFDPDAEKWAEPVGGTSTQFFAEVAREVDAAIAFGMVERAPDGTVYNALVLLDRRGNLVEGTDADGGRHPAFRKLSAPSVFSGTLTVDEAAYCTPGPAPMVFDLDGVRVGALICYDRAFSEVWLANRHLGADVVLVAVSSFGWRESLFVDDLRLRAMEVGVFVVASNRAGLETHKGNTTDYFGRSCIIAPSGTVLAEAPAHEQPAILDAHLDFSELEKARTLWPVWNDRRPELYRFLYRDV
jgi:beta-ureidopropionase